MTIAQEPKRFGRPAIYPFSTMPVGATYAHHAPTAADTKRVHRAASNVATRDNKGFRGKMDLKTRVITFTRVR